MKRFAPWLLVAVLFGVLPSFVPLASATLNEQTARNASVGDGSTTAFSYTFKILTKNDIEVLVDGVTKTVDTDYTVTGMGVSGGGTVTFTTAPASAAKVTLLRKQAAAQASDYIAGQSFPAEGVEKDLDKLAMQVQQDRETLARTLRAKKEESLDMTLPAVATRKSKVLGFDTTGLPTAVDLTAGASGGDVSLSTAIASGAVTSRSMASRFADWVNVKDYGAVGDGLTSDQVAIAAAVAVAYAAGHEMYWPDGTYLTTATIPNFHDVRHRGPGAVLRGSDTFYVEIKDAQTNKLYLATTGNNANDGLTSAQPRLTFQSTFDVLKNYGPVLDGTWNIIAAAGTYTISGGQHTLSTPAKNRVVVRGPAIGHPNVPTAIIDGGGNGTAYNHGLSASGIGVRVEFRDLKFTGFTEASGNTRIGLVGENESDFYTNNVHSTGSSWTGIYAFSTVRCRVAGGILDGNSTGAYGFVANATECTFGYGSASTADGPRVRNTLSAGVYWSRGSQGHVDYGMFDDNAVALFVAEHSRCDTVGNDFKRNTVAIRTQSGGLFGEGGAVNVMNNGGADANTTNVEHRAFSGDTSELDNVGAATWMRIAYDRTARTLSGSTPTTLTTPYTIPAYRLAGAGKQVRVLVAGVFTQATAGSTITVNFGGLAFTVAVPGAATNVPFEVDVTLYEVAGGYRAIGKITQGLNLSRMGTATATFTSTSDQAISVAATLADAGDSMAIYRTDVYIMG